MSSAICFNLDQPKILLSGNALRDRHGNQYQDFKNLRRKWGCNSLKYCCTLIIINCKQFYSIHKDFNDPSIQ